MAARFEVYKDKVGRYRWRLRHQNNNNIIADSAQGYTTERSALRGVDSVRENAPQAPIVILDRDAAS